MDLKENPLISALTSRQASIALKLIEMGDDVNVANKNGDTALMIAVGIEDVFQAIIEKKPDIGVINNDGETVLHIIAINGSVDDLSSIKDFIIRTGEINRQNEDGDSALLLAVSNPKVFEELLNMGADLHVRNKYGETVIHKIAELGTVEELELLSKHCTDFNCTDKFGNTPLHIAASYGEVEIVEKLIKLGAKVDALNNSGETPLHQVIDSNVMAHEVRYHIQTIRLLIQYGANIHAKTNKGNTPLELAQQYFDNSPHSAFRQVLLEYGAK